MSWRRFTTLLTGLSAKSRFIAAVAALDRGPVADVVISDDRAADDFIGSLGV